jgi:hypothetical protein
MDEITQATKPTLEEVKDQLEGWRANKINHREPIPKELWQAAADLARDHSINTVSKALKISYTDLKNCVYPSKYKPTNKEKASFIELKYSLPLTSEKITVEIENKKGCKMRIYLKADADITTLIKPFCSL